MHKRVDLIPVIESFRFLLPVVGDAWLAKSQPAQKQRQNLPV
jgi:hypothetical protein